MDNLEYAALLYLIKTWEEPATLPECYEKLQQTKADLQKALKGDPLNKTLEDGSFAF